MSDQLAHGLPAALLEVSLLLAVAVLVGLVAQRIHIPITVVLAVVGVLLVELGADLATTSFVAGAGLKELLLNLFLPILIFEAALGLSTREFMRNLVAITGLATVALVISAGLVGVGLNVILGIPLVVALLFGVLISATDPVAVVAIFREVGVPKRLLTIVEGESLLNDGVAIVLYSMLLTVAAGHSMTISEGVTEFIVVSVGGLLLGAVAGTLAVLLLPHLPRLPAAAFSVAIAYSTFVLAEIWHVSGVMATLAAGVAIGGMLESRAGESVRDLLHELWESLAFIANALLFLFIGLALDFALIRENLAAIGVGVVAVLVARPLAVIPLMIFLERATRIPKVGNRNSAVVVWGGLRGGVALALALALPQDLAARDQIVALTGGVVMATLLVNATTISFAVHALGLDKPTPAELYLEALGRFAAVNAAREKLRELDLEDDLVGAHLDVAEADARDELSRSHLSHEAEVQVLVLRGLHIERETYQGLADAGLLPPIATRTLLQEIDDEIEEVEVGELRVDAARRAHLPWYGRAHRWLLGVMPEPLGVDLTEVAYIEVSARRLAAGNAVKELEAFRDLPQVELGCVDGAVATFVHWRDSAAERLAVLEESEEVDRVQLKRRQAKALGHIAAAEVLNEMVMTGVLSPAVAEQAAQHVSREIGEAGH
ncbi:cation:proton antiporter [Nocardioides limicola]|uniref:cation:proton antiporter n=1 Tax=Nocardioides limicola TaxID=2803368 RepID=UPI00193BCFD0|nr:sodium:proton antiporter [Nocardioides sp. DJM-14]